MAAVIFETLKIETFIENWSLKIENSKNCVKTKNPHLCRSLV